MRFTALRVLCLSFVAALPASAAQTVTTVGVTVTLNDNCGFTVGGSTDGWVRLHLKNDPSGGAFRDFWVRAGQYYPLRASDVRLPDDTSDRPSSLTFDDSQTCAYTRSQGLDECNAPGYNEGYVVNAGGIAANVGFFATTAGEVEVRLRSEGTTGPWHLLDLAAGEFVLGDIIDCQLVDGSGLTYLTAVAP